MPKPICFVALAFGKDDATAVYDKLIVPTLKKLGIKPERIDRRHDNRFINLQIVERLRACDFCIADLTYARPSVYFEAGMAEGRPVELICTARRDHLKKGQPEELSVHFDLDKKPIITWKTSTDKQFVSSLTARIRQTFLIDYQKKAKQDAKRKAEEAAFVRLPMNHKLELIFNKGIHALHAQGFRHWRNAYDLQDRQMEIKYKPFARSVFVVAGIKISSRRPVIVGLQEYAALEKNWFKYRVMPSFASYSHKWRTALIEAAGIRIGNQAKIIETKEAFLLLFVDRAPIKMIMSMLPHASFNAEDKSITMQFTDRVSLENHREGARLNRHVSIYLLDSIRSLSDLKNRIEAINLN